MRIELTNTGKRYNHDWIFRHVTCCIEPGKSYALTGPNGSGKSTLLQVMAGAVLHNEGSIAYHTPDGRQIPADQAFQHLAIAAPYLDLVEEMTGMEFLAWHACFKPLRIQPAQILEATGLAKAASKQIRYYSSGMKQRLKLGQAFFSDTSTLLLDEPTSNLDAEGCALYQDLLASETRRRTVIIGSNDPAEYASCGEIISILSYKVSG